MLRRPPASISVASPTRREAYQDRTGRNYDACPCIGSHVTDTREIGTLRITSHDHADGVLRICFKLDEPERRPET